MRAPEMWKPTELSLEDQVDVLQQTKEERKKARPLAAQFERDMSSEGGRTSILKRSFEERRTDQPCERLSSGIDYHL
jgi:hypothetical protein